MIDRQAAEKQRHLIFNACLLAVTKQLNVKILLQLIAHYCAIDKITIYYIHYPKCSNEETFASVFRNKNIFCVLVVVYES